LTCQVGVGGDGAAVDEKPAVLLARTDLDLVALLVQGDDGVLVVNARKLLFINMISTLSLTPRYRDQIMSRRNFE
jgi:hypothetical protein